MVNKLSWPEWYRIVQPSDLLHPDGEGKFRVIPEGLFKHLQKQAQLLLANHPEATPLEKQHWQDLVNGFPPYGLKIEARGKKGVRTLKDKL